MRGNLGSKVQPILNFSLFCHFVTGDLDDRQIKALLMIGRTEVERHTEIGGDEFFLLRVEGASNFFRVLMYRVPMSIRQRQI